MHIHIIRENKISYVNNSNETVQNLNNDNNSCVGAIFQLQNSRVK